MRHGTADPEMSGGTYGLTPRGREEAAETALVLAQKGLVPQRIWHSSKTRAAETARIVQERLCPRAVCEVREGLLPDDSAEAAAEVLEEYAAEDPAGRLLIVSHLPFLPSLVFRLLRAGDEIPSFSPASCCWMEMQGRSVWTARGFWAPGR